MMKYRLVLADLQSASIEYKHLQCDKQRITGLQIPIFPYGRISNPPEQVRKSARTGAIKQVRTLCLN